MRYFVLAALAATACVETAVQVCGDLVCDPGLVCVPERSACHDPGDVAACDGLAQGEPCAGSTGDGVCDRGVCGASPCGDGVIEPALGEVCDDGNVFDGDGCDSTCRASRCLAIPASAGDLARPISDVLADPACREVFVSPGTYAENLEIARDVDIIGGDNLPVVIDGGAAGPVITVLGQSATLERLTLTNGSSPCGGGIFAEDSDLLLLDVTIAGNDATIGGGICQRGGSTIVSESEILDNTASTFRAQGGGVWVFDGSLIVRNQSRLSGNRALGTVTATGGAIHALISSVTLAGGCALDGNAALADDSTSNPVAVSGGAVSLEQSDLLVSNCALTGNTAGAAGASGPAFGGAVYGMGSTYGGGVGALATLNRDTVVSGNVAQSVTGAHGGAVFMASGNLNINRTTLESNSAIGAALARGGAILLDSVRPITLSATSSTIGSNVATSSAGKATGGGIAADASPSSVGLFIFRSTVAGNEAISTDSEGGALWLGGSATFSGQITNTTISGNSAATAGGIKTAIAQGLSLTLVNLTATANSSAALDLSSLEVQTQTVRIDDSIIYGNDLQCALGADEVVGAFNLIEDIASCPITGTGNGSGDPLLAPLADNGGPTLTHLPDSGGAAVSDGQPDGCSTREDQRGYDRAGVTCAVGAVDPNAAPPAP